ncbi:MAG: efflux RND transporter periplasmic adaptor subunit, partial [Janthinobacterium lividum]
ERGDYVKAGQTVISMKDEVESASRNVAAARAQLDAELKAANATRDLARAKVKRARDLTAVGFISKESLDQSEAELLVAQNRVGQAEENRKVSRIELDLSNAVLNQRSIRSPFAGVVMERYRTEGERIEREPILRIAKVDPLRVEVVLSFSQYGQIKQGDVATVKSGLPDAAPLKATVTLVDRMVDSASNTFRVRLALPNPGNKIPPGLRCSIAFDAPKGRAEDTAKAAALSSAQGATITRMSYELMRAPKTP